jgi:hypothetical protein
MGTPDEKDTKENQKEPFESLGRESICSEVESVSPGNEFLLRAECHAGEGRQMVCDSRLYDEILSASCDCHGDSCCC